MFKISNHVGSTVNQTCKEHEREAFWDFTFRRNYKTGRWKNSRYSSSKSGTTFVILLVVGLEERWVVYCQISLTELASRAGNLTAKNLRKRNISHVIEFVKRNIGTYTPLLAGNSVYVEFQYLKRSKELLGEVWKRDLGNFGLK
ncbi:hypothetical protein MTR67_039764 [Solanum verrucosum]|uniref:Uncharacterized protein n=1 Tax=Solanum verrucosum TaxID=315347 RepID=A0AAF0UJL4_SOLVR|nr:hypothetical protein MTR67_039764 [Solanum verrucosum]